MKDVGWKIKDKLKMKDGRQKIQDTDGRCSMEDKRWGQKIEDGR